jgi:hypothetical protein
MHMCDVSVERSGDLSSVVFCFLVWLLIDEWDFIYFSSMYFISRCLIIRYLK